MTDMYSIPDPLDLIEQIDVIDNRLSGSIEEAIKFLKELKQKPGIRLAYTYYDCGCYYSECGCERRRLVAIYKRPRYFFEKDRG